MELLAGADCDPSHGNTQDPGKVQCQCDALLNPDDVVYVIAANKNKLNDKKTKIWFEGIVAVGETFDIDASYAGKSKLDANTYVFIFDSMGGTLLQTIQFHTSCSQPLNVEDIFCSLKLVEFVPEP